MKLGCAQVPAKARGAVGVLTAVARWSPARLRQRAARVIFLPWLVLAIGIPASLLLFGVLHDAVENLARLRFEREASEAQSTIELRIQFYANVLHGLKALFAAEPSVSRVQFRHFVNSLDLPRRYPGLDVVNFAQFVRAEDREKFEASVRGDASLRPGGYPGFAIRPAGERAEYHVIVYLEPMEGYDFAFGLDLAANPAVTGAQPEGLAALQHAARDSGVLTASGLPIRIKAAEPYVGLAMRLAVYRSGMPIETVGQRRAAYLGSVGAGFNVQKLIRGAVGEELPRYMHFMLYDVGSADGPGTAIPHTRERLLFDSRPATPPRSASTAPQDSHLLFVHNIPMEVGGRVWEIHFNAVKREVIASTDALLPWVVAFGGIVSSVLLFGVLRSMVSSQSRAETLANEMTRSLRESEASLAEAHALLNDAQKLARVGCCQYSPREGRLIWSEELYRIHGVDSREFTPGYDAAMALVHPDDREAWNDALQNALHNGQAFTAEFRIVRPDGTVRHLRSLGEVIADSSGPPFRMLWSVLDITEQKETEHALRSSAEQLTALSRRLVEIQESERRQLSRELHDRVGQNLTALSINLDILNTTLEGDRYAAHRARLNDSSALLESTVDSIENVMAELRPPMLDDYGLLPALQWYAKRFLETHRRRSLRGRPRGRRAPGARNRDHTFPHRAGSAHQRREARARRDGSKSCSTIRTPAA